MVSRPRPSNASIFCFILDKNTNTRSAKKKLRGARLVRIVYVVVARTEAATNVVRVETFEIRMGCQKGLVCGGQSVLWSFVFFSG
jgi:hypothetical protein